jgi:hypothetical protein
VTPGVYFLESQYRDAEGRYYEGASQTVDVGCDGAAGLSQPLEGTDVVLPKLPEEPHALLRLKFPAFMPEAYAAESARLGGCEADPDEPPCACGKLRVCVFSGDNRLPASGGMLPVPVKGEIGRWTWLGRDMPPKIPYKFEQDFANALGQASPCYDIVPMDATWSKIAWHGQEFRRIFEQLKAARAAGDTALAEQLTAAAKQLRQRAGRWRGGPGRFGVYRVVMGPAAGEAGRRTAGTDAAETLRLVPGNRQELHRRGLGVGPPNPPVRLHAILQR